MASKKISELPVASALDGTELVPIVQGGVNKSVAGALGAVFTWATKPLASAYNGSAYISDIGVGGSHWYSDGSKWRPVGGRVTIKNTIADVTNNGAPKVVLDYATIPAGLWGDGDLIDVLWNVERTGGAADSHTTDLALGIAPAATVGTSLGVSTGSPSTTNLDVATRHTLKKDSATSIRPLSIAGSVGLGSATAANTAVTVANMDTQTTYLQITSDLSTAGGEVIHLRGFVVTLICGS